MFNLCINGLNGSVCVRCTEVYIRKTASEQYARYIELFKIIMTSTSHTDNMSNAINVYNEYIQNTAPVSDILLIEMIMSYAKLCILRNKPAITIRYIKINKVVCG